VLEARRSPVQLWSPRLRRGVRRPRSARGTGPRDGQGAPDDAVRPDGEARTRPAHERRLAARPAGGRRGCGGADPTGRAGARGRDRLGRDAARRRSGDHREPPEFRLAELGDLGGAIGASLLE
jgi:hypothetical protein